MVSDADAEEKHGAEEVKSCSSASSDSTTTSQTSSSEDMCVEHEIPPDDLGTASLKGGAASGNAAKCIGKTTGRKRRLGHPDEGGEEDDDDESTDPSNSIHNKIRRQAEAEGWPDGPDSLKSLFDWAEYNADRLLNDESLDLEAKMVQYKRLMSLLSKDIEVHEAYGGSGNGGTMLHRQITALQRSCEDFACHCALIASFEVLASF